MSATSPQERSGSYRTDKGDFKELIPVREHFDSRIDSLESSISKQLQMQFQNTDTKLGEFDKRLVMVCEMLDTFVRNSISNVTRTSFDDVVKSLDDRITHLTKKQEADYALMQTEMRNSIAYVVSLKSENLESINKRISDMQTSNEKSLDSMKNDIKTITDKTSQVSEKITGLESRIYGVVGSVTMLLVGIQILISLWKK